MHVSALAHLHIVLVFLHVLALAVGLGSALLADWVVLSKMIFAAVSAQATKRIAELSKSVCLGLVALWATGLSLVAYQWQVNPTLVLANEKVWAKVAIVCVLTVNAAVLHWLVLPTLARREGLPLFGPGWSEPLFPTFCGAASASSWLFAVYLGVGRELNGIVTWQAVVGLYGVCLLGIWAVGAALAFIGKAAQNTRASVAAPPLPAGAAQPYGCRSGTSPSAVFRSSSI